MTSCCCTKYLFNKEPVFGVCRQAHEKHSYFKVFGTPTMVFLDGDKEIGRVRGYVDAETFSATLNEIKSSL
jgi:thioredoxin-related protein